MTITLDETAIAILFVLFMLNTWINYRLGYKQGIFKGHMFGVKDLVDYMINSGSITGLLIDKDTQQEREATNSEIAAWMLIKLHERHEEEAAAKNQSS